MTRNYVPDASHIAWLHFTPQAMKNYPFEGSIAGAPPSVALADQAKSLDWRVRKAERKGSATPAELAEARAKLKALIDS